MCSVAGAVVTVFHFLVQAVMERLACQACGESHRVPTEQWRSFRLYALDGSTVSMPREAALFDHFGAHRARTTTVRYPLATFAVLLHVDPCLIRDYRVGPFDPGEDKTSRPLLAHPGPGDLLLADRGFAGSPTLARIKARGADFLMRKNARLIVERLPVVERLGCDDFITDPDEQASPQERSVSAQDRPRPPVQSTLDHASRRDAHRMVRDLASPRATLQEADPRQTVPSALAD